VTVIGCGVSLSQFWLRLKGRRNKTAGFFVELVEMTFSSTKEIVKRFLFQISKLLQQTPNQGAVLPNNRLPSLRLPRQSSREKLTEIH
jgi:hypothetical protein